MKKEAYYCDIDKCNNEAYKKAVELTVVFTTEQNEGRPIQPYLSSAKFDLCNECLKRIIEGRKIPTGSGTQGFNKYSI